MRKYLALVLGVLFILSFTIVAFAQDKPEITLGGKILVRGWYFDNVSGTLPEKTGSQQFYSTNANIMIDAKVTDNVRGYMELETSNDRSTTSGLYYWGAGGLTDAEGEPAHINGSDRKPKADLFFRQLWIQYTGSGLMGVPAGIKVGHQPITLGEKQFLNNERFNDDAILVWVDPTKESHIALGTIKILEGNINSARDDANAYIAILTYMWDKDNVVGVNYTLVNQDNQEEGEKALTLHNVGLHANGNISGVSYGAEVDLQFGKASDDNDYSGYGILAKLGYMIDPLNVRASFAYGSGDSSPAEGKHKEFQTLVGTDDIGRTARLVHYTQIYERTIQTASMDQDITGNSRTTGIANTTYYNLGLDVNPMKELSLSLDGFYMDASNKLSGQNKHVGEELDFKGTYKIAKNLSYFVEAGMFWPGKFYTTGDEPIVESKKNVTQVVHGLSLTF